MPEASRLAEALWYDQPSWLALPLLPLAWAYGAVAALRRWAWTSGLRAPARLPVPVLVVGNITAGGAGKTPVVEWLVGVLVQAGFRPGIVSRGHGGTGAGAPRMVRPGDDAALVGDEPLMLCRSTGLPVCVGRDRVAAGRRLLAEGVNIIVADDGLQHYRLARDLEIVVVDGQRRLGNGWLLPAGPLREPVRRLRNADLVLVNGGPAMDGAQAYRTWITGLQALGGTARCHLADLAGSQVRVVAGIGNPRRLARELESAGLQVIMVPVPDHGRLAPDQLCDGSGRPVIMTAKDAVKYPEAPGTCPVWVATLAVDMPTAVRDLVLAKVAQLSQ